MVELSYTAKAVRFAPCHRIVASRLPTIHLFERVADPADWGALYELESRTNPRIRTNLGELHLVPVADCPSPVVAAQAARHARLVSRSRSSHHYAAHSFANFGIKGH